MTATAWLFPGQGSQRKGMGAELFARYPEHCATAQEILGFSVPDLCLEDRDGLLKRTRYTQPALFVLNALAYLDRADREPAPAFLAGHSVGEYNALFAAGSFDFETGVRLVGRRGELMDAATGGAMTAVVGPDVEKVPAALAEAGLDDVDIANHNSPEQIVLSGSEEAVTAAAALIRQAKLGRCVPLAVSAAFHSRHMAAAAAEFATFLRRFQLADPRIPVVANVTARPYEPGRLLDVLSEQVRSPVRWSDSMRYLLEQGVRSVTDMGPGTVVEGLWQAAVKHAPVQPAPLPPAPPQAPVPPPQAPVPPALLQSPVSPAPPALQPPVGSATPDTPPQSVPAVPAAPVATATTAAATTVTPRRARITAARLGSAAFRDDYGLRYAYLAGSMYRGVASTALVTRMARAGLMGFFGTGGLAPDAIERALLDLRAALGPDGRFGMNLLHAMGAPEVEDATVGLYLRHDMRFVEAAGFTQVTPALVRYRLTGVRRGPDGAPVARNRVLAKVSRPEVAAAFMRPAPAAVVQRLVAAGVLTAQEAEIGRTLPMSEEICVEADSAGHTDGGVAYTLIPTMARLRDQIGRELATPAAIRVGTSGGLGTPESVAAAFVLGADFVMTGSVNQCTAEAGTSDAVKEMLAGMDVQDTAYAPAGDMFEIGARVQVLRKGTLFAARANKLYQAYRTSPGLDRLEPDLRRTIEETYFRRGLADVWQETREHYLATGRPQEVERAERDPRHKMALVFRWYFAYTTGIAMRGVTDERVNFQVHTGPAMGAFNRFAAGTPLARWRDRHPDDIAEALMTGAAEVLNGHMNALSAEFGPAQL